MCLLDDVCLIKSKILAPPIVSTFEHSSTWTARYELSNSWGALRLVYRTWNYDRKPSWQKSHRKDNISLLAMNQQDSLRRVWPSPRQSQRNIIVLKMCSWYYSAKTVGWETNASHAECGQLSIKKWILNRRLIGCLCLLLNNRKEVCAYQKICT